MWIFVMFDLPTETKEEKKAYTLFRKGLLHDGFRMFQFSTYIRHCASRENADVHIKRVKQMIPSKGHVGILMLTDRQFGNMKVFYGKKKKKMESGGIQLEMF